MEERSLEKRYVSYEDLHKQCVVLAEKIHKSGFSPNMIVSVTRGGLLSAYFLADRLGVKSIETINITSTHGTKQTITDSTKLPKDFTDFKTLIVDDLIDSGKTMKYILNQYTFNPLQTKIAAIYCKSNASFKPDFFVEELDDNQRIIFPYQR